MEHKLASNYINKLNSNGANCLIVPPRQSIPLEDYVPILLDLQSRVKQLEVELAATKQELATLTRRHDSVAGYVKHLRGYLWGYKSSA